MDVPAEEERCIAAEGYGSDKGVPGWIEEEADQGYDLEK